MSIFKDLKPSHRGGAETQLLTISHENDKEIVLAAVKYNGYTLQYASVTLKNDKDVVLAAVSQNGGALQFASPVQLASPALQQDPDVLSAANRHAL